ncbi:MAG: cellulase family glycosylhydrolase [Roseiflexaceae bacterium]
MFRIRLRSAVLLPLLACVLPLLAACGGAQSDPSAGAPTAIATQIPPTSAPATALPATAAPTSAPADPTAVPTAAPTAAPTDGAVEFPLRTPYLEYGIVEHLYYTDRERVLTLNGIAGFEWVRQQIHWKDIEGTPGQYAWGELDNIVEDVASHNQRLLISIVRSPSFYNPTNGLPQDPATMGNFVEAMMKRYGNKIGAVEIWNEQNLAHENGGRVTIEDAGRYVEILVESFKRIKAVSPETYVLAGGPSSSAVNDPSLAVSDENYFRAMYSYKNGLIKDYFDAQAVHPGGAANPPDTFYPENPSFIEGCTPAPNRCWNDDETHYFRHIENVRRFMVEEGVGDHQMWVTEFGWATQNNTPGYEFGNFVSQQQQADYIVGALKRMNDIYLDEQGRPWVGVAFLWNMNFAVLWKAQGNEQHEQASFGILNGDWSPRPSFLALQAYLNQVKQQRPQ